MSKLYLALPFLLLVQEFHHTLGYLSYPLVQGFLGILEDLGKRSAIQREDLFPINGLMYQLCIILVKEFVFQNCSYVTLYSQ